MIKEVNVTTRGFLGFRKNYELLQFDSEEELDEFVFLSTKHYNAYEYVYKLGNAQLINDMYRDEFNNVVIKFRSGKCVELQANDIIKIETHIYEFNK